VCQGLGRFLDVDPWLLRGVFVLLAVAQGPGVLFYLVLWLVVPAEQITSPPRSGRAMSRVG
jgi:phage shock protein C